MHCHAVYATLFAFALVSTSATASLSPADHPVFGQASLTRDSQSGLDWLTPNETVGLSFTQTKILITTDQRFAGFRVASLNELQGLYLAASIPDINVPGSGALYGTPENVAGVEFLQTLTGITYSVTSGGLKLNETAGYVGETFISSINGLTSVYIGNVVLRNNVPTQTGPVSFASAYTTWGAMLVGTQTVGVGTWLVTTVPEPSIWLMFSFGLLALAQRRARVVA